MITKLIYSSSIVHLKLKSFRREINTQILCLSAVPNIRGRLVGLEQNVYLLPAYPRQQSACKIQVFSDKTLKSISQSAAGRSFMCLERTYSCKSSLGLCWAAFPLAVTERSSPCSLTHSSFSGAHTHAAAPSNGLLRRDRHPSTSR